MCVNMSSYVSIVYLAFIQGLLDKNKPISYWINDREKVGITGINNTLWLMPCDRRKQSVVAVG